LIFLFLSRHLDPRLRGEEASLYLIGITEISKLFMAMMGQSPPEMDDDSQDGHGEQEDGDEGSIGPGG